MNDVLSEPLRGAAIYNPHLLSEQEVEDLFVVRLDLLEEILGGLRSDQDGQARQHRLIVGQRGMGKTMLLRRIQVAIDANSDLRESYLALTFPEEQWDVSNARDFWLNCLDSFCDALERRGGADGLRDLDGKIERLPDGAQAAKKALELLTHLAQQHGKTLVLLVDNVDQILERVEEWSLRETLSSNGRLVLIGASSAMLESSFEYDRAFYDFLKVDYLEALSLAETERFLLDYASRFDTPEVTRVVEENSGRIGALHTLSGGNPRTTVLFYKILGHGFEGDVKNDLEQLLDQCTPLYKARVEELPPQSQRVLHGLAMAWHPISAGELAEQIRISPNAVSSQLSRLQKYGLVASVEYPPGSKNGYQIAERFFNIWFLMRGSRRVRRRMLWLARFLQLFYQRDELRANALQVLKSGLRLGEPSYLSALADSLSDDPLAAVLNAVAYRHWLLDAQSDRDSGRSYEDSVSNRSMWGDTKDGWSVVRPYVIASAAAIQWAPGMIWEILNLVTEDDKVPGEIVLYVSIAAVGMAVDIGRAREAKEWMAQKQRSKEWEPLMAALEAQTSSCATSSLKRLAPEIRQPAEDILDIWKSMLEPSAHLPAQEAEE